MTSPQDTAEPKGTSETPSTEAEKRATPEHPAAAEQAAAPAERPRPAYGEYAPEGWSWEPPGAENSTVSGTESASPRATSAQAPPPQFGAISPDSAAPTAQQPGAGQAAVPPSLSGVPHNLGVGQQRSGTQQHAGSPAATPAPTSTQANPGAQPPLGPAGANSNAQPARRRLGDRVVTVLLLAAGAIGSLNFASSFMNLPRLFTPIAEALGDPDWVAPAALNTIGTVGTLTMLALFAITLIFSVQRIRRHKLAFFVPLVGGVVAFIVAVIIMSIAFSLAPEISAGLTPENFTKVMDALAKQAK